MDLHANAKLGLAGRRELVLAIESGCAGEGSTEILDEAGFREAEIGELVQR